MLFYLNKLFFSYIFISDLVSQHTFSIENLMIMAETVMQTFNSLNIDSKRLYQKRKSVQHDIPSIYSNTVSPEI